ncbi:MAG: MFS transporter [Clostridiaceae bacterium]
MLSGITSRFIDRNFHALTHKNFRYFWLGQCASLIGTWMQNIGQSWLVLSITNSPLLLGLLGVVQFIPMTFFSLFAGVVVDKFPKKKILIFTQFSSMVLALILAFLVFTNTVRYEYILVLAFILGCINCIDNPARQSFTVEIAGREDLMNAIALNSAVFNLARILGPSIGALVMVYLGAGWCFLLNGLSYIAVIFGLCKITTESFLRKISRESSVIKEIKDGLNYVKNSRVLFETILMMMVMGIFAFNYNVLVPSYTKLVLLGDERTYGILMSFLGIGSLIGAIIASMKSKKGLNTKVLLLSSVIISFIMMLNGINKSFIIAAALLCVTGMFNIQFTTTANSTLQLNTENEYRGRVMSVYSLVFGGTIPIGSLFTGLVSDRLGPSQGFFLSGIFMLILMLAIKLYFEKGQIFSKKKS